MSKQPTARRDTPAKSATTSQASPGSGKTKPTEQAARHDEAHQGSIRQRAYELYEQGGRQEGRALEDWMNAERELANAAAESRSPSRPSFRPA